MLKVLEQDHQGHIPTPKVYLQPLPETIHMLKEQEQQQPDLHHMLKDPLQ